MTGQRVYRPTTNKDRPNRVYTSEDRRAVVKLINDGWPPLDVAVAYDIPVYKGYVDGGYHSKVYDFFNRWCLRYA